MKKYVICLVISFGHFILASAQVGIGTTTPDASAKLQIDATDKGFLPPRVSLTGSGDVSTIASPAEGLLVYHTGTASLEEGYYFWNGAQWSTMATVSGIGHAYGDVKTGMQTADHAGWVLLNGRAKSTLTSTQQTRATAVGIGTNIPNALNSVLMQNGSTPGTVSGSNTKTIAQNQLPNVSYTGSILNVAHGAHIASSATGVITNTPGSSTGNAPGGGHTEHFYLNIPLNGGVTQQALDITPKSLSINTFIYLGN
ncbi:MAG: hypothetical protein NWR49_09185 [Crocinitomicaceae bacterium]|nr:hypothetical protein [Crocinitomicaceae bacterium]